MANKTLEWVGTGSGFNPVLGNTSFLVTGDSDRGLLVDCGATVPQKLISSGRIGDITDVIITHPHGDHFHGLEGLGFFNHFVFSNKDKPNLYVASDKLANQLRRALDVSMGTILDNHGNECKMTLDDYFNIHVTSNVEIPGLPRVQLFPTKHVGSMENYGVRVGERIFYSGDTVELPPSDPEIIFQDCQFFDGGAGDVHTTYRRLREGLSPEVKAKTYLVHLGSGGEDNDPIADGFAGFVNPGDKFEI